MWRGISIAIGVISVNREYTMSSKDELEGAPAGSSKKNIIIMVVAALLLVGGSVGVTVMMLGKSDKEAIAKEKGEKKKGNAASKAKASKEIDSRGHDKAAANDDEEAVGDEASKAASKHKAKTADAEEADAEEADAEEEEGGDKAHQFYVDFAPAFVVNLPSKDKQARTRFLKVEVSAASKEDKIEEEVKQHMPAIRNKLVMLFSKQVYEDLISAEGKESLRQQALAEVQKALKKAAGKKMIKDLYFTSFVMQ
jgi:flagellar protein FliL